ncbi:MAG: STAS domain-containing protein [Desulfococcaceae bacterium]
MNILEPEARGDVTVVAVRCDRLDASVADRFKEEMAEIIPDGGVRMVLDLSKVKFIDSTGIGAVASALKRNGPKGRMMLCGAQPPVRKVFEITRFFKIIPAADTREAAVAALVDQ